MAPTNQIEGSKMSKKIVFLAHGKTDDQIINEIQAIQEHEKISRAIIGNAAAITLQHAWEHSNPALATKLVQAVTPANRTAIVLLMKECTSFTYDSKAKAFGKLSKEAASEKNSKLDKLAEFFEKYEGDLWKWFEKTKEDKIVEFKFNEQSLVKQLAGVFATNGGFTEQAEALIAQAKAKAAKMVQSQGAINARISELVEAGISADLAKKQAQLDLENGKLIIPDTVAANDSAEVVAISA